MAGQTLIERYDIFFATSTFGANANGVASGFRQRDVKFFIELFVNWVDPRAQWEELPVQNTHISRYIDNLVTEGFARKLVRKGHPRYRLSRTGLIELIRRVVSKPYYSDFDIFFFVYSYIENYTPRALDLVEKEGKQFPYAMQLELESLLDLDALLNKQIEFAKRELRIIEERIEVQVRTRDLVADLLKDRVDPAQIWREVELGFPYSLNTKKPFSEFLAEGTPRQAMWELLEGGIRRNSQMWVPARERLKLHIHQLEVLGKGTIERRSRDKRRGVGPGNDSDQ